MGVRWIACGVLAAGCGRLGFDDTPATGIRDAPPEVCGAVGWTSLTVADRDVDLAVVPTPNGVTVIWVPRAGGDLMGVNLDPEWNLIGDRAGTTIKPGGWSSSAAAYVNGSLVTAQLASDRHGVKYEQVEPDLGASYEFGCPRAYLVTKPPILHVGSDLVSPTAWDDGLTLRPFATDWTENPSQLSVTTTTATGLAAAAGGEGVDIVWSTDAACFVEHVMDQATGIGTQSPAPCAAPRIAAQPSSIAVVFEAPAGVFLAQGDAATLDVGAGRWLSPGASPRIAYDGSALWISYLDGAGHIVVGHLTTRGELLTTSIAGSPLHDAYELAIVSGQPWVFAIDPAGLAATMLCVPPA